VQMQEYHPAPQAPLADTGTTVTAPPLAPPGPPAAPIDPPVTPTPAGPSVPPREPHSGLARFVLPLIALAIGVLGMIDLAGADVAASAYVALPLTIVGLGLVVRAWYGRGWSLAVFGALLALALVIVTAAERVDVARQSSTWRPLTVDQVDASYSANVGDAVLDLSAVDFAGQSKTVRIALDAGNLTVILPAKVDVQTHARVNVGNAVVFGESWGGIGQSEHAVTDLGSDGQGGGDIVLNATVNVGNLEVRR
jgi:hypothetical protein